MSDENISFEEAYNQLEETVQALEHGGLTLDEATSLYEKGMHLAHICNQRLSASELKISRLQRAFSEQMSLMDQSES